MSDDARDDLEQRIKTIIESVDCGRIVSKVGLEIAMLAIDVFVRAERLREAEWWEHLVGAQHTLEKLEDCEPDCMYCQRIAELRAEEPK